MQALEKLSEILEPESLSTLLSVASGFTAANIGSVNDLLADPDGFTTWIEQERKQDKEEPESVDASLSFQRFVQEGVRLFLESTPSTVCGTGMEMLGSFDGTGFRKHCLSCKKCADALIYLHWMALQKHLVDCLWLASQKNKGKLGRLLGIPETELTKDFVESYPEDEKVFSHLIRLKQRKP
ncbi:MAG: hypothetical protein Q7K33_00670 [Candidatus Berkelbacteria bacterium]|nr:hypothetical protein [Candidatus Berkelbacteria bacterium]